MQNKKILQHLGSIEKELSSGYSIDNSPYKVSCFNWCCSRYILHSTNDWSGPCNIVLCIQRIYKDARKLVKVKLQDITVNVLVLLHVVRIQSSSYTIQYELTLTWPKHTASL